MSFSLGKVLLQRQGRRASPLGLLWLTSPPSHLFFWGLHGDAETLKISVPIQTPGPAPALTPLPVEEKEKIIAMPVAGRRSSGAVRVSPSVTAAGVEELSGAASTAGGGGELAQVHVTNTRNFAVKRTLPTGGDSIDSDDSVSDTVAECEVETGVTAP
jgi:hypothetical protein